MLKVGICTHLTFPLVLGFDWQQQVQLDAPTTLLVHYAFLLHLLCVYTKDVVLPDLNTKILPSQAHLIPKFAKLSTIQQAQLDAVIGKFSDVFYSDDDNIGLCPYIEFKIDLQHDKPIRCRPYRLSEPDRQFLNIQIQKWLKQGICCPSNSTYAAPAFIVEQPFHESTPRRVVIDYSRTINSITKLDPHPIDHMEDVIKRIAGRRAVLLARWIVRSVPLEIVGSRRHEKVPTRGKPGLERRGRPRGERIVRQALVNPIVTRSTIRADLGVAIVPQTISRHLAEANLKSKRPFRALPLTPEHRQLRLQWRQARSIWNVKDWQKVVFSDESRFVLGTDDNRVRVWRRLGERRSTLIVICGTLTGQRYVDDILRPYVGPFLNGLPGAIFQQDIARPHTARVAEDFLCHFQTLPWPGRCPYLSPVVHVWDQLKRQMPSCHSVQDLDWAVQDLWAHLPQDIIRCLINSMPDRVVACIAAEDDTPRKDQLDLLILARAEAANNVYEAHLENKHRFDFHRRSHSFKAGDLVLYDWPKQGDHKVSSPYYYRLISQPQWRNLHPRIARGRDSNGPKA
ncbi:transposable element Tcb2 transposase [Trichonephila clavipes]|uniref:Transposable element Tcb2 transposase n=1 Tax=Trichonephila clavipes TaxID=2585209 RepID=A0A8X6SRJ2_TRICX|nr:transposable element Tcb2 transposase [Trichonephila clavipes]